MGKIRKNRIVQIAMVLAIFGLGFIFGSLSQQTANSAGFKDLGQAGMGQLGQPGGKAGSIMEMGKSIAEMQQHVDGLQKNIDTLKGIKSAIGG